MTAVAKTHLHALYAAGDDPWDFRTSAYEQQKFNATVAALARQNYASGLEIGCGNGELARHIAPRCASYTGVDAVGKALHAARRAVPKGRFVHAFFPCELPGGPHDLIILSEVLYFFDRPSILMLGQQITRRWREAEIVVVTWLGPSGNLLEGEAALALFTTATSSILTAVPIARTIGYRIDRFLAS